MPTSPARLAETLEVAPAVRAIRAGDRDAFRVLVERFQEQLLRFARGLAGSTAAAEELAQAAFVRAYLKLDSYDEARPFFPWLAKIAFRLAQDRWASETRAAEQPLAAEPPSPDGDHDPLRLVEERERESRVWRAIDDLSRAERAAVLLYYREEMGVDDAARVLGVSPGTIKTLLFRARGRLRSSLKEYQ